MNVNLFAIILGIMYTSLILKCLEIELEL